MPRITGRLPGRWRDAEQFGGPVSDVATTDSAFVAALRARSREGLDAGPA